MSMTKEQYWNEMLELCEKNEWKDFEVVTKFMPSNNIEEAVKHFGEITKISCLRIFDPSNFKSIPVKITFKGSYEDRCESCIINPKLLDDKDELIELNYQVYGVLLRSLSGFNPIQPDIQAIFCDNEVEIDCPKSFTKLYPQKLKVFLCYRYASFETENGDKYYAELTSKPCTRTVKVVDNKASMRMTDIREIGYNKEN